MRIASALSLMGMLLFAAAPALAGDHVTPVAPQEFLDMSNPVDLEELGDAGVKKVARLYKGKCAKCHGPDGAGDGTAAADMLLKPTNFTTPGYFEKKVDGQLYWIIQGGSKGTEMKAFGPGSDVNLSEEEMWQLVAFMRANFAK